MTVEDDDDLSIYKDSQDKMIPLNNELPDNMDNLAD